MGVSKAKLLEVAARRNRVVQAALRGATQREIAVQEGISQTQVCKDLQVAQREWLAERRQDTEVLTARRLAEVEHTKREYWRAWERSIRPGNRRKTKRRTPEEGQGQAKAGQAITEAEVVQTERDGDPRWLAGVLACLDREVRWLGLEAPRRFAVDPSPLEEVSEEDLAAARQRIADAVAFAGLRPDDTDLADQE